MRKKLNLDGTEQRVSKSFRIEETLFAQFKDKFKKNKNTEDLGLTMGAWIRKQIIMYINNN
jgi:hypothetical protein